MSRPFVVFDIDGTLIRWQLYHALADELARQGRIDAEEFQRVRRARMAWKKRTGEDSFKDYEETLVSLVNQAITGIKESVLKQAAGKVLTEYIDQVYTYTRDLIQQLKEEDYLLFTLSASQSELVGMLATYYGFDDWAGTVYQTDGKGFYTGQRDLLLGERKPEVLKAMVEKHGATWQGSIAVGDSEGDIPMLEQVERPIAFNPTKQLFDHARSHNWRVVLERKNVVYQLEPKDGKYQLKN